ncbi:MAG: hypothetical protein ACT4P2_05775 [Pseudomonadota bacterium]
MKVLYLTVITVYYAARALCLYRSLEPYLGERRFAFYCMDEPCADVLERLRLPKARVVRGRDFETEALRAVKPDRALNEYCWTAKPFALLHALSGDPSPDWAVYLDGDMMAFGDPDRGLAAAAGANVVLTAHRFATPAFAIHEGPSGRYNAGYVACRSSPPARRALAWWGERCLEFCPNVPTADACGDQKYLEQLPGLFDGVHASAHKGLNAAPWNIEGYRVAVRDGTVFLDDDELLLFHFQGLQIFGARLYDLYAGHMKVPAEAARHIYRPYVLSLRAAIDSLRQATPGFRFGIDPIFKHPMRIMIQAKRLALGVNNLHFV